jgi:hypothetical protein
MPFESFERVIVGGCRTRDGLRGVRRLSQRVLRAVRRLDPEPRKPGDSMGAIASQGAQTG